MAEKDNKAGAMFENGPETPDTTKIVEANGTRDREVPGTCYDELYLSPEDMQDLGCPGALLTSQVDYAMSAGTSAELKGDTVLVTIRDHQQYSKAESDRFFKLRRKYPSAKIVQRPGSDGAARHMDSLYVQISRAEYEADRRSHDAQARTFTKDVIEGEVDTSEGRIGQFNQNDKAALERQKRETHELLGNMLEKWPGRMSYEDVLVHQGAERTQRLEFEAARGGRVARSGEFEEYQKEMKSRSKNRTYSLPGSRTR